MIWYLIGYVAMAFISGPLVMLYAVLRAKLRGFNAGEVITYMFILRTERVAEYVINDSPWFILIVDCLYNIVCWPIEVLCMIFVDMPEAIEVCEFYNELDNMEEA